eukprot:4251977-Prymnesium_polylepis.1
MYGREGAGQVERARKLRATWRRAGDLQRALASFTSGVMRFGGDTAGAGRSRAVDVARRCGGIADRTANTRGRALD